MDSKEFNFTVKQIKILFPLNKITQSFKDKKIWIRDKEANTNQIDYLQIRYNAKVYNTLNIFTQEKTLLICF